MVVLVRLVIAEPVDKIQKRYIQDINSNILSVTECPFTVLIIKVTITSDKK